METVRANFKRVEEYGWFLPGEYTTLSGVRLPGKPSYRKAAVIFLIGRGRDGLQVLMTKRSNKVATHTGEPCLPGGMQEEGDSGPVATALREAQEEVQLEPGLVEVVTVLPPFPYGLVETVAVTPVVCFLKGAMDPKDMRLVPNDEVDCVFWVPLALFVESKYHVAVTRTWRGWKFTQHGFRFLEPVSGRTHFIWGLTAMICIVVSAIALNMAPAFPCTIGLIHEFLEDGSSVLGETAITSHQVEQYSRSPTAKL